MEFQKLGEPIPFWIILCVCVCVSALGIEARSLCILGKCYTTELYPQPSFGVVNVRQLLSDEWLLFYRATGMWSSVVLLIYILPMDSLILY